MVRAPRSALVTPGWAMVNAIARWVIGSLASSASGTELFDDVEAAFVGEVVDHTGAAQVVVLGRLGPTLAALLDAAVVEGTVRDDISAEDLLHAITQLSQPVPGRGPERNRDLVALDAAELGLRLLCCGSVPLSQHC